MRQVAKRFRVQPDYISSIYCDIDGFIVWDRKKRKCVNFKRNVEFEDCPMFTSNESRAKRLAYRLNKGE